MKKKNLFIAVMALALTAVGCSKIDAPTDDTNDLTITFQMGDKGGFNAPTKALKTGWADGDYVSIVFMPEGATQCLGYSTAEVKAPRMISLEWNEETNRWITSVELFTTEGGNLSSLGTTGTYYAVHHRGNVSFHTNISAGLGDNCYTLTGYKGGELLYATGTYAYSDSNLDLGTINMTLDPRLFQVSVHDELNGGNLYLSEGIDAIYDSGSMGISNPEESMLLTIYSSITDGTPSGYIGGTIALREGAVTVDFSDPNIFKYSGDNNYKKWARPVANRYDEYFMDYSFCFAVTGMMIGNIENYVFYIERSSPSTDYTIDPDKDIVYKTYSKTASRSLTKGNAYRLGTTDWTME